MNLFDNLVADAEALLPETIALRRDIHAHPELGNDLPRTQRVVVEALEGLGLSVVRGKSLSSVVAVLDSGRPGPTVLLRGDMDALPMHEDNDFEFRSTVENAMHACGHDAHVAMLVSAAHLLVQRRDQLTGKVVFMFQPGEEGHGGAAIMIDEGVLEIAGTPDFAFAIHQSPSLPNAMIATRGGTLMASSDEITVTVTGKGGHASSPYLSVDPIPVACEMVLAMQTMITRRIDAFDPAVVTIAHIAAGTTSNVIPEKAMIHGTIRTVSAKNREYVRHQLRQVCEGLASAHGVAVDVDVRLGYPVTVNNHEAAIFARDLMDRVMGPGRSIEMSNPVMGAEDFSYILEKVPGAMVFLGTCPEGVNFFEAAPCHSNLMVMDEGAMSTGVALYAAVALEKNRGSAFVS